MSRVQIVERFDDARRVECCGGFVKVAAITEDRPEFAAKTSLHEHVDKLVITVRVVEAGDERTAARHHYVLLAINVLLLQGVDNVLLLEALESEGLRAVVRVLDQFHPTESANAQCGNHVQLR